MRILHTMLRVTDLERSIAFYTDVLGMNLLRRKDYPEGKFTLAFLGYGSESNNTRLSAHLQQCFRINITRSSVILIYKHQYNHKKSTKHLQIIFKIFRLIQSSDACGAFKQYHIARSLLNSTLQTKIKIIAAN